MAALAAPPRTAISEAELIEIEHRTIHLVGALCVARRLERERLASMDTADWMKHASSNLNLNLNAITVGRLVDDIARLCELARRGL